MSGPVRVALAPEGVPAELRERHQWACAFYEKDPLPGAKPRRIPISARHGRPASRNQPADLASFADVATLIGFEQVVPFKGGSAMGIGAAAWYALQESEEVSGFDLDGVTDDAGEITSSWASETVERLPEAYWERTPSGRGLRGFVREPPPKTLARHQRSFADGSALEVYDSWFLSVTGARLGRPTGTIGAPVPGELERLLWDLKMLAEPEKPPLSSDGSEEQSEIPNDQDGALRMLRAALRRIRTAPPGSRNITLNAQAFLVGKIVGAALLDLEFAHGELLASALGAGLPESEARDVLHRGLAAGQAAPWTTREREKPDLVATHPLPTPTRPIVKTAIEAQLAAGELAESWRPGDQSLVQTSWPGFGKTTAFGLRLIQGLARGESGFEGGVAVLVLPTRNLVHEKAEKLQEQAHRLNLAVDVIELLGRNESDQDGWWCEAGTSRTKKYAALMRSACSACEFQEQCKNEPGRFRHRFAAAVSRIKEAREGGRPVLVLMTHALLPWTWSVIPAAAPIVIDDPDAFFSLAREIELRHSDVVAANDEIERWLRQSGANTETALTGWMRTRAKRAERARERKAARKVFRREMHVATTLEEALEAARAWAGRVGANILEVQKVVSQKWRVGEPEPVLRSLRASTAREALPEVLVADIVLQVLRSFLAFSSNREASVTALAVWAQEALREGCIREPKEKGWPWERIDDDHGDDLLPSLSRVILQFATEAVGPRAPLVERRRRLILITLPDRKLISRAKHGRVAWATVGPMPSRVAAELGARTEVVIAEPEGLRILVLAIELHGDGGPFVLTFGHGKGERPSMSDLLIRDIARRLHTKFGDAFAAVLHKADASALARPQWCRWYGQGHAGSDELEHASTLLVRRFSVSPRTTQREAEVLRRTFGWETPPEAGTSVVEARTWPGDARVIPTPAPAEPLEKDVALFHEVALQLNAIGRCRPLTHPEGRTVVLAAGKPIPWTGPVQVMDAEELGKALGIEVELPPYLTRNQALAEERTRRLLDAAELKCRAEHYLSDHPGASAHQLATQMGVSGRAARRLISLSSPTAIGIAGLFQTLRSTFERRAAMRDSSASRCREYIYGPAGQSVASDKRLLSPTGVGEEMRRAGDPALSQRTVQRHVRAIRAALLDRVDTVPVGRSDQAKGLAAVLRSCIRLADRGAGSDPQSRASEPGSATGEQRSIFDAPAPGQSKESAS